MGVPMTYVQSNFRLFESWSMTQGAMTKLLLTWLLTRLSGVPMLEHALKKRRPGYEDYIRRTSSFFPWPPKA